MNYKHIFQNLKTVRDFKKNTINLETKNNIINFTKDITTPNNQIFSVDFLDNSIVSSLNGKVGYYGKIIEAPTYLVIKSKDSSITMDSGYFTEFIRFKLQEMDLGSCWISIDGADIKNLINCEENIVAMLAVGEIYNGIFKKDIQLKSDRNALSEIVFLENWGQECSFEHLTNLGLDEVFHYTRFAPSWGNKQPWKFIIKNNTVYIAIEKDELNNYILETGIISFFFEKACVASGIVPEFVAEINTSDILNIDGYEVRVAYKL